MSLQDVAEILNVSKQTINKWEKELRPIPEVRLSELERIFSIPRYYFGKEIDEEDKIRIQKLKIESDSEKQVVFGMRFMMQLKGLTKDKLSEKLNIDYKVINDWVKKIKPIPNNYLDKLSSIFEIDKEYIMRDLDQEDVVWLLFQDFKNLNNKNIEILLPDNDTTTLVNELKKLCGKEVKSELEFTGFSMKSEYTKFQVYIVDDYKNKLFIFMNSIDINSRTSFQLSNLKTVRVNEDGFDITIVFVDDGEIRLKEI